MNGTRGNNRASAWLLGAVVVGMACAAVLVLVGSQFGALSVLNLAIAAVGVGASTRAAQLWIGAQAAPRIEKRKRLLLVGAGGVAQHLYEEAQLAGYDVLGYVADPEQTAQLEWPRNVLGPRSELGKIAQELAVDQVIVTDGPAHGWQALRQLDEAGATAQIFAVPEFHELALCRPFSVRIADVALCALPRPGMNRRYYVAKRIFDVAVSVALLVLFAPVILLSMLLVRLTSAGPALYRQERVGKDGRLFEVIKLRTMVAEAESDGPQLCKGIGDPRLTPVGRFLRKTHLDEVPQLWNVLRGEMSLVGPRPERPVFVEQFNRELPRYDERHRILPGITGLAQVNGFYHSSPREKLRFDLMYLYHPSLWLDMEIITRTLLKFFH